MFEFLEQNAEILLERDGRVQLFRNVFDHSKDLFQSLKKKIEWEEKEITIFGKTHPVPRLSAWYGDQDSDYSYSGIKMIVHDWIPELLMIKKKVETISNSEFNGVLCNLYRNGRDYAAWHSDDELELGKNPVIASVSLGATRSFHLRHKTNKGIETYKFDLEDNTLLLMDGSLQHHWKHQLAKTSRPVEERINLTFRKIF